MCKNNGLKRLGFVGYKYCLLMKINEGAASVEKSGNGGRALMSLPCRLPSRHTRDGRTDYPRSWFPRGGSVLSSSQKGETEQFPCCLHSLNIHPSCSKRKTKKKGKKKKAGLTFSVASQAGGKGRDKWILSRSLACGAHSLYRPARAWLGEVINVFRLEQGAHCWSLDPLLG